MKTTNSKRTYELIMVEGGGEFNIIRNISIDKILFPSEYDWEYIYALNDLTDKILDLKDGSSLYFQPNRDNYNTKGIILRKS